MKLQGGISGIGMRTAHPYSRCFFGRFASDPCRGRIDPCHIVSQQTIKREWHKANLGRTAWSTPSPLQGTELRNLLDDPRNIVYSCRHHHSNADAHNFTYEIPPSARAFAEQYDLSLPATDRKDTA